MPVSLLGAEKIAVSKIEKPPTVIQFTFYWGEMNNKKCMNESVRQWLVVLWRQTQQEKGNVVIGVECYFCVSSDAVFVGWCLNRNEWGKGANHVVVWYHGDGAKALSWECMRKRKEASVWSRARWEMIGNEVWGVAGFYVGSRLSLVRSCRVF